MLPCRLPNCSSPIACGRSCHSGRPSHLVSASPHRHCLQIDFVRCDVRQLAGQARLKADTVVMNPPFGTRRKGAVPVEAGLGGVRRDTSTSRQLQLRGSVMALLTAAAAPMGHPHVVRLLNAAAWL